MRSLLLIWLLSSSTFLFGQGPVTYNELLKRAREINLTDSFLVDVSTVDRVELDSVVLTMHFSSLYPPLETVQQAPMHYYFSGKLTSHPQFNLLLVSTRREQPGLPPYEAVYLLTTKKDGTHISSLSVATRKEKGTILEASAWLHKDFRVFVHTSMRAGDKIFTGRSEYRINEEGRFIYYPHWSK